MVRSDSTFYKPLGPRMNFAQYHVKISAFANIFLKDFH